MTLDTHGLPGDLCVTSVPDSAQGPPAEELGLQGLGGPRFQPRPQEQLPVYTQSCFDQCASSNNTARTWCREIPSGKLPPLPCPLQNCRAGLTFIMQPVPRAGRPPKWTSCTRTQICFSSLEPNCEHLEERSFHLCISCESHSS